ncbi:MAG: phage tail tape measure protein [Spirochaetes bacterium]|nr:phage tail tape measure protein [Spirochaetota bacterium]
MQLAASIKLTLIDAFSSPMNSIKNNIAGMKSNLDNMKAGKDFSQLATELTLQAAYFNQLSSGIKNFIREPSMLATNLQDSMASVHSVLNQSNAINGDLKKSLEMIRKESIDFSKTHSTTATDFIKANYNMLSAGLNTEQSIVGTVRALKLAKATMGESTEAGNLLATIYNNMADKTKSVESEMTRLSDIVAQTQATFQIANLGQLSEGLKYAIPSALQYGMTLEQVAAVIGQLNTAGLQGTMAGTSFNAMMAQMIKASRMLNFNIVYDETGALDLISTIQGIKDQFGDFSQMSDSTKQGFTKAFGQEGLRSVTLLIKNLESLNSNFDLVQNSTGATETMYSRMTNTLKDRLQITENRWNALKIRMGENVNVITSFGNTVKMKVLDVLEKVPDKSLNTIFGIASGLGTAASAGMSFAGTGLTVAAQIATIANIAKQGTNILGLFGNMAGLVLSPFKLLTGGILKLIPVIWTFTGSLLACPITWIILGIIAVAAGVYLLIKNWSLVSAFFVNLWNQIKGIFSKAWNFIWNVLLNNKYVQIALAIFMPFIGIPLLIIKNFSVIKTFFINLWGGITGIFSEGVDFVKGIIDSVLGFGDKLLKFTKSLWPFGKKTNESMAGGIESDDSIYNATQNQLKKTTNLLPQSDAKEGPLSKLTVFGKKMMSTIASGVEEEPVLNDTVKKSLDVLDSGYVFYGRESDNNQVKGITININNIESISKNIDDIKSLKNFVDMLANAAGVAL